MKTVRWVLVLSILVASAPGALASADECGRIELPSMTYDKPCDNGSTTTDNGGWTGPVAQTIYAIVGIVGSGGAAFFGWNRVRKRRLTLRETMRKADETYAMSKTDPQPGIEKLVGMRAELATRHKHGKVDDGHYLELDRRIRDYITSLRIIALEMQFPELPHEVMDYVKELGADGILSPEDVARVEKRAVALKVPAPTRASLSAYLRGASEKPRRKAVAAMPPPTFVSAR